MLLVKLSLLFDAFKEGYLENTTFFRRFLVDLPLAC